MHLPQAAVRERADGQLSGHGWLVRWRWHPDGSLEYRSDHRMTDESWDVIAPDGTTTHVPVPFSAMLYAADASEQERARVQAEYHAAWGAHGERVLAAGMAFETGTVPHDLPCGPGDMVWRLDGGPWQATPLAPR